MEHREEGQDEDDFDLPTSGGEAPLQPDESDAAQLADERREIERLERRLVDQELRDEMARDGFAGPRYELWREDMARYAIAVLHAELLNGAIYALAADKGRPASGATTRVRQLLREDRDARSSLVNLLVAKTLKSFRKNTLLTGAWKASEGAGLHTYFIGAAHLEFSTSFREWKSTLEDPAEPVGALEPDASPTSHPGHHPEHTVIGNDEVERLLQLAPKSNREILCLYAEGYSQAEIAEVTGRKDHRAVEAVIYRYRQTLKSHGYS